MLLIQQIKIYNFVCFEHIEINPSTNHEKPLTVVRAENGSGKTTLLRAIRWGMYGDRGLPGNSSQFSLHPAEWRPDERGVETKVIILFESDGSTRNHPEGRSSNTVYSLERSITTVANKSPKQGEPDFRRINEEVHLLAQNTDGSWEENPAGANAVIEELLPWELRDFFLLDTDEVADFVGGSENKVIERRQVIAKTSFAIRALLGLDVFNDATERVLNISQEFGREATKATRDKELNRKQSDLDEYRQNEKILKSNLDRGQHEKVDTEEKLNLARTKLESLIGNLGAHEELKKRLIDTVSRLKELKDERKKKTRGLSSDLAAIDLFASLAIQEISHVHRLLQPMYDDGSIPLNHLGFVQTLLENGTCVCGRDLSHENEYRHRVVDLIKQSGEKKERSNYLAQVLHASNMLYAYKDGDEWRRRCAEKEVNLASLDSDISDIEQKKRDIDRNLDAIDDAGIELTRNEIQMLEENAKGIERKMSTEQAKLENVRKEINKLDGEVRAGQRRQKEARDLEIYEKTANTLVQILKAAYNRIRDDQVQDLSIEMDYLFAKMAANVIDDEELENGNHKTTLRMISKVGLIPLENTSGEYEIYALNSRGRPMPPTEINGASRRILALSFVLGLCNVSRTKAPLIADSLLNFMSGSVRTNTLRITSETASQPILLLTGSDLESQSEVDLVDRYAGAKYTLTGQWQHTGQGGDVLNQSDARQISLICHCGPREYCDICERLGQANTPGWNRKLYKNDQV